MSAKIINFVSWPDENGIIAQCCCDTAAELPAVNAFSTYGTLVATSTCRVINESATYQLNTAGVWKKKTDATSVALDLSGYYTSAEVDSAISAALATYALKSEVIPEAGKRGTLIVSTVADKFDILSITTTGRYFTNTASGTYSLVNSPLESYGINKDTGACTINGVSVTFNATAEIIVEEIGAPALGALQYTMRFAYNSSSTSAGPTAGRNLARSKYWTLIKDAYSVTQWIEHTGTAL